MASVSNYIGTRVYPRHAPERGVQWINTSADNSAGVYCYDDLLDPSKKEKPNLKMKEELCLCTRNLWN